MSDTINISIRTMVEFILRSGDIDVGYMSANRAVDGIRLHQKIQKLRKKEAKENNEEYLSEAALKISFDYEEFTFNIDGRADGIHVTAAAIEEIKTTLRPVIHWEKDTEHWHWAQAKCYGHMYCEIRELDSVKIRLTYCHVETEETLTYEEDYSAAELRSYFYDIIDKYLDFARMDSRRIKQRNETGRSLGFPYGAYRRGQWELCVSVYVAVKRGKKLFAQAPTGTGKTISALFPSVKALTEGLAEKIFYITAKTITRQVAEDALSAMAEKGLTIRSVTLTAKDKICPHEVVSCDPEICSYAKGHFDRVNEAILDIISNETLITRRIITKYADKHTVCPFEFMLDVSLFCDVIICDYNHVYDPKTRLKRYFYDGGKYILLNDEAHNLVDRARDMFSAAISKKDVNDCAKLMNKKGDLYKILRGIAKYFREQEKAAKERRKNGMEEYGFKTPGQPEVLYILLREFITEANDWLTMNKDVSGPASESLTDLFFRANDFLKVSELFDERYITFEEMAGGDYRIKLYCLDPSLLLAAEQKKSLCSVFFSATLTPLSYFQGILGGDDEDFTLKLSSPFPEENLRVIIDSGISTRYKDREQSYEPIADRLMEMISLRQGNYMAFFPSYAYLNKVLDIFTEKYPDIRTLVQTQDMEEEYREIFLSQFDAGNAETLLAFAVLGGMFSEGIDLTGDRLIGAAIAGVGLPLVSPDRNVISEYYQAQNGMGFSYAYLFPGMNKVLQAAGRVIRSEMDRGVILLMDPRFLQSEYQELFPADWMGYKRISRSGDIAQVLNGFWDHGRPIS